MLIDVFYLWGEKWVELYDRGYNFMAIVLIVTAIALYVCTGVLLTKNFNWFPCNKAENIITCVLIVLSTLLTVAKLAPNSSIITSGAMSLYIAYQTWSGLNNGDSAACNAWYQQNSTM
jgi:uncharacterized MnhB-related membrane protein